VLCLAMAPVGSLAAWIIIDVRDDAPANATQAIVATLNSERGNADMNNFQCLNVSTFNYHDGSRHHAVNNWNSETFGDNEASVLARVDKMAQRGTPWIRFAVVSNIEQFAEQMVTWGLSPTNIP